MIITGIGFMRLRINNKGGVRIKREYDLFAYGAGYRITGQVRPTMVARIRFFVIWTLKSCMD